MEDIRRELSEAYARAARFRKAGSMLNQLRADANTLLRQREMLEGALLKESADVDKLESGSLSGAFFKLLGKFDERLEKERAEWLAAKLKYEEAEKALESMHSRIRELEAERASLQGCEEAYAQLYECKKRQMLSGGGQNAQRAAELIEEAAHAQANLREIGEAVQAGECAAGWLDTAYSHLKDAEGWGCYDMLGGGLIASSIKYDHVDDAAGAVSQAQAALYSFNAELADVAVAPVFGAEISGGLRMADMFFDGLIVDWMAQRGIEQSLDSVGRTRADVAAALARLNSMSLHEQGRLCSLEETLQKMVLED